MLNYNILPHSNTFNVYFENENGEKINITNDAIIEFKYYLDPSVFIETKDNSYSVELAALTEDDKQSMLENLDEDMRKLGDVFMSNKMPYANTGITLMSIMLFMSELGEAAFIESTPYSMYMPLFGGMVTPVTLNIQYSPSGDYSDTSEDILFYENMIILAEKIDIYAAILKSLEFEGESIYYLQSIVPFTIESENLITYNTMACRNENDGYIELVNLLSDILPEDSAILGSLKQYSLGLINNSIMNDIFVPAYFNDDSKLLLMASPEFYRMYNAGELFFTNVDEITDYLDKSLIFTSDNEEILTINNRLISLNTKGETFINYIYDDEIISRLRVENADNNDKVIIKSNSDTFNPPKPSEDYDRI